MSVPHGQNTVKRARSVKDGANIIISKLIAPREHEHRDLALLTSVQVQPRSACQAAYAARRDMP